MRNITAIIARTLKTRKTSMIVYTTAAVLFMWMYVAMFPTLQQQSDDFRALLANAPAEFLSAFGLSPDQIGFNTLEQFMSLEQFNVVWPLMVIFLMVSFAGFALSRGIEEGTIENILATPVSRLSLFFGRYFAGILMLIFFALTSVYSVIPLAAIHHVDVALGAYWRISLLGIFFGWAILSIAMMFSALFSERGKTYMFTGGILLLMYVAQIASSLIDSLDTLKYASFFYYFDQSNALVALKTDTQSLFVFAGVALLCTALGARIFHQRDIAV